MTDLCSSCRLPVPREATPDPVEEPRPMERSLCLLDHEPQPGDGPDYHASHAAWRERQRPRPPAPRSMSGDAQNLAKFLEDHPNAGVVLWAPSAEADYGDWTLARRWLKCDFCDGGIAPGEAFDVGPGCFFHRDRWCL